MRVALLCLHCELHGPAGIGVAEADAGAEVCVDGEGLQLYGDIVPSGVCRGTSVFRAVDQLDWDEERVCRLGAVLESGGDVACVVPVGDGF